jgi:hypothetical protein
MTREARKNAWQSKADQQQDDNLAGGADKMKRAAVVIGVDRTGDLPMLAAAARGAADFGGWCKSQRIDTTILTDADNCKVTIKDIRDAIRKFVDKRTYTQLILFFAGHGILKSPDEEYWLLSDAPGEEYEAVNLVQSVSYARNTPFKHIVFISDACRTVPQTARLSAVKGMGVFQNLGLKNVRPKIDQYYATAPADPAYEAPLADAISIGGIFTRDLLRGLKGEVPSVPENSQGKWFVTTRGLDPYLMKEVPASAAKVKRTLRQIPEVRGESNLPLFMASLDDWAPMRKGIPPPSPRLDISPKPLANELELLQKKRRSIIAVGGRSKSRRFDAAVEEILNTKGRQGFESGAGFSVVGAKVSSASAKPGRCDLFVEDQTQQVRIWPVARTGTKLTTPASVLLEFEDGRGTILAAWPGLVGTVLVKDGRVVNVNYTPARHTPEYKQYEMRAAQIEQRRALVAAAARSGRFRLNAEHANQDANYLRTVKKFDPTLGLYAAYAYAQVGAIDEIVDVMEYMRGDHGSVPFDVALLARKLGEQKDFVPFCPMLTQGWAYLEPKAPRLNLAARRAWSHLVPSLWTTFDQRGVKELRAVFK